MDVLERFLFVPDSLDLLAISSDFVRCGGLLVRRKSNLDLDVSFRCQTCQIEISGMGKKL